MEEKTNWEKLIKAIKEALQAFVDRVVLWCEEVYMFLEIVWFWLFLREDDLRIMREERRQRNLMDRIKYPRIIPYAYTIEAEVPIPGSDFSHWDGPVDFVLAINNGLRFCWIKACDGAVKTKWYEENSKEAEASGMPFGPYFWLYPSDKVSITAQVSAWWSVYQAYGKATINPAIDWEWTRYAGQQANPSINDLRVAIEMWLDISGGVKPFVYTAPGYAAEYGPITDDIVQNTAGLWVAHYGTMDPAIPPNYTKYTVHQYSESLPGYIYGVDPMYAHYVDGNSFNGTEEDFAVFAHGGVMVPPQSDDIWKGETLTKVGVFASPVLNGHIRGARKKGLIFQGTLEDDTQTLFLKIDDKKYLPVRDMEGYGSRKWMKLSGPINPPIEPPKADIWTVKKWGEDKIMLDFHYDTANIGVGNFQVVTMLIPDGDVDPFYQADQVHLRLRIPHSDVGQLYNMQIPDYNWKGELQSRAMKMNWLCQYRGRPYLQEQDNKDWEWTYAQWILWGEMVFGGQKVEALEYKTVFGNYRGVRKNWDCAVIRGITKEEWAKVPLGLISHDTHPQLIQRATSADRGAAGENLYNDTPKGKIFAPLWGPGEWYFTGLSSYQPKEWCLPLDVLKRSL